MKYGLLILFSFMIMSLNAEAVTKTTSARKTPLVDFDVSGSTGNYNGQTYSEVQVGLNLNFTDWLTWRNAAFKRFSGTGSQDVTGLDSSIRLNINTPFDGGGFRFFLGPGYRWADPSDKNAAFAEGGVNFQVGRFSLGAGAKYLRYDKAQFDSAGTELKRDDVSYFVTLAGGAGLSF